MSIHESLSIISSIASKVASNMKKPCIVGTFATMHHNLPLCNVPLFL